MGFLWKSQLRKERGKFLPQVAEKKNVSRQERLPSREGRGSSLGVVFLWFLFLGTIVYLTIFSSYLRFTTWQVTGLSNIDETNFHQLVDQDLSKKYLGFISRNTFFSIQPRALEQLLREQYPLLREVTVERIFPATLLVGVRERNAIVLWCSGETCAHVLEDGSTLPVTTVYQEEVNQTRTLFLRDESGEPLRFGSQVFESDFILLIFKLREELESRFGIVARPDMGFVSRFANEIRIKTGEGWEVYFSTRVSAETSLGALSLLLGEEIPKERHQDLSYIDLRTENRIFYRYQDGKEEEMKAGQSLALPTVQEDKPAKKKK